MSRSARTTIAVVLSLAASTAPVWAQQAQAPPDPVAIAVAGAAKSAVPAEHPATLVYANRAIVEFRATVVSRTPLARAAAAAELLDRLVEQTPNQRVATRAFDEAIAIGIGTQPVIVLFHADADPLQGEDLVLKANETASRLQLAFDEAVESRTPRRILQSVLVAVLATAIFVGAVWLLIRIQRVAERRLGAAADRRLAKMHINETLKGLFKAQTFIHRLIVGSSVALFLVMTYSWLTIVLRRFPYTRPWGESLRSGLLNAALSAGRLFIDQLPNLLIVVAVILFVRFLTRLTALFFKAVEEERVHVPWIHPEIAQPTKRILTALLWIFALVVSYDYLPGSGSDAFKGASVFVGLVVSLGSTGVMNQIMSGLMVTYSRALRVGDFVRIGDVEGTVTHLGALSTKVKTPRNEEITIPNALVVSQATTNFTRYEGDDGVYFTTSVTIGYKTPWRQVHALLLMAAERTAGVLRQPEPKVLQTGLQDFYVQYTLFVCPEQPRTRTRLLAALHANIQDAFNEYGVQIMSPNYEADPDDAKVVPQAQWYAAPAAAPKGEDAPRSAETARTPVA
jgi:small-conductance mechanosensitive channel